MPLLEYARATLFDPLGIPTLPADQPMFTDWTDLTDPSGFGWYVDTQGISLGGLGISLRAQDMAKIGLLYLNPREQITAINLSTVILVVHGWFYVFYVLADFNLWSPMRWSILRLGLMFLGGIVPLLSFILERRYHREVVAVLDSFETEKVPA